MPVELSQYTWVADRGVIEHKLTGRRMVIFVSLTFEAIFEELEKELGEPIAEVIIGAQNNFMKTGFFSIDQVNNEDNMRAQFALRGMGNLKEMKFGEDGLSLRVENPAVPLLTVGFSQGLFELAFGIDSKVAWNQSQDGDLDIVVTPK